MIYLKENISRLKSLMGLLTEETVNPKDWVVGKYYDVKIKDPEYEGIIVKVTFKDSDNLTYDNFSYNDTTKKREELIKDETSLIFTMLDETKGMFWEESNEEKWNELLKYEVNNPPTNTSDSNDEEPLDTSIETDDEVEADASTSNEIPQNENCEGNCVNGKGILLLNNGAKYDGNFINGKFEGRGVYEDETNNVQITGKFSNGELNGNGTIQFFDGTRYMGFITSENGLKNIKIKTLDNRQIDDVINYHYKMVNKPASKNVNFELTGEVYFLNELKSKFPIENAKIIATIIENDKEGESLATNSDKEGKFSIELKRGIYNLKVESNNGYFISQELKDVKLYNNIDKNFIMVKNKKYKDPNEDKEDDLVSVGIMTLFNSPKKIEKKLYKKSETKKEYCEMFTEFYYKMVIEKNNLFEDNPINQNNLTTSKNFIVSCYNEFSTDYDNELKEKVKTLTNLAGDIEIFEL